MDDKEKGFFEGFKRDNISDEEMNEAVKKSGNLKDKAKDFLLLIDMVKDYFKGEFDISKVNLAIIIGCIIYVISPIDAAPDFIPFVGWLDDGTVVAFVLASISAIIEEYKLLKKNNKQDKLDNWNDSLD